jgi:hypothetical protein
LLGKFKRVTKADHQSIEREQLDSGVAEHGKRQPKQQPFNQQQQEQCAGIRHKQQLKITLQESRQTRDDWAKQFVGVQL